MIYIYAKFVVGLGISKLTKTSGVLANRHTREDKSCKENNKKAIERSLVEQNERIYVPCECRLHERIEWYGESKVLKCVLSQGRWSRLEYIQVSRVDAQLRQG